MPKRIGFLFERVITPENCIAAEMDMVKHKRPRGTVKRIRGDPESYGMELSRMLAEGRWEPQPYIEKIIYDGYRKKERRIKVPCLQDQAVHHAVMRITIPHIMRRNYYYNCGSIPGAGQSKAVRSMAGWLKGRRPPKYGEYLDIHKLYDSIPHAAVMVELRRIIKDEKLLALHAKILASMSDTGIGIAIGFYPSMWYANLLLGRLDMDVKQKFGKAVKLLRYMDDYALLSNNKRKLHQAREFIRQHLAARGLALNRKWQVFPIRARGFTFLGYRFFPGYTILAKRLMYRIARKIRRARRNFSPGAAASVMSYMGILRQCNSYHFRQRAVYGIVSIKKCKEVVSNAAKNAVRRTA